MRRPLTPIEYRDERITELKTRNQVLEVTIESIIIGFKWMFFMMTIGLAIPNILVIMKIWEFAGYFAFHAAFDLLIVIVMIWLFNTHRKMKNKKKEKEAQ